MQAATAVASIFLMIVLISGGMYGCPKYNVYHQHMEGMAELSKAESNRKIKVLEAQSHLEAAKSLAAAEVERAKGVAEANRIIGSSLQNNEAYLRYLWIHNLETGSENSVIYVPTEAGLPILEAGKRATKKE